LPISTYERSLTATNRPADDTCVQRTLLDNIDRRKRLLVAPKALEHTRTYAMKEHRNEKAPALERVNW